MKRATCRLLICPESPGRESGPPGNCRLRSPRVAVPGGLASQPPDQQGSSIPPTPGPHVAREGFQTRGCPVAGPTGSSKERGACSNRGRGFQNCSRRPGPPWHRLPSVPTADTGGSHLSYTLSCTVGVSVPGPVPATLTPITTRKKTQQKPCLPPDGRSFAKQDAGSWEHVARGAPVLSPRPSPFMANGYKPS